MARKFTFVVKAGSGGAPWCLLDESHNVRIKLSPPIDIQHAMKVAVFLNANIADIEVKTGASNALSNGETTTFGGCWATVFNR
ncbi:hypothetical protein [Hyphomicrobium sp. CS1GBMeth3]|uniref:hypothetical protein n=1 Tax=Hyphomicrobium sp. CS1GBMeth3 TaxID=1892845 RepID=UPI000A4BEECA|nr:hypothetical protein [Hyphomicrobium sp. CS1GBMeth3]